MDGLEQPCFVLVEFGLVWFGCSTDKKTNDKELCQHFHKTCTSLLKQRAHQ